MILHCATPVTVRGTPCAVSTPSHIGLSVMTSSDRRWTSVTSHQAHAHPPTIVLFRVDPQHPPGKMKERYIVVNDYQVELIAHFSLSLNLARTIG